MLMLLKAPLTSVYITVKSVRLTSASEAAQSFKWSASEWMLKQMLKPFAQALRKPMQFTVFPRPVMDDSLNMINHV